MHTPTPDSPEKRAQLLKALEEKYKLTSQDTDGYLEGLLYADYLSYWDYIHLETLLSLQNPRTVFPDENIFITYHQVTELYFKMILSEMKQIGEAENITESFFLQRMERITRYFQILVQSFDVMSIGMDGEQFRKFRMTLMPASGFQSAQFRMIEIRATDFINIVDKDVRHELHTDMPVEALYEHIYWKKGATEVATGKQTLTLQKFEEKYEQVLMRFIEEVKDTNLWAAYQRLAAKQTPGQPLKEALRLFDTLVNIDWALAHFRSAMHYLHKEPVAVQATGGTNWQQYLPPIFQKRIFYPQLWTEQEKSEWGKSWVEKYIPQGRAF
ncbi:tryptophan 2,3-dioxygenase [Rhodocytophaga rosea]|uniref:Tryptophan 2,3-dioxygenase n=1 Tax=Rhodocytophaga rosea TaxID=2704465 RepID=A0A6C0GLM0_9BACT|nr:tryptophan 2,3-dioxygenase family protein [Rhodocytophaga rosea]QHT68936.1 tryptophan 2,3-dioxygenase [Rhodocytophaga rosea]